MRTLKMTKKLLAFLLVLVMTMAMGLTASAAMEGELTGGSITIEYAVSGQTYNVYQLLYLESYDADKGAYAYKANSAWDAWLRAQTTYVDVDEQGYVTWVDGADAAAFAKAALEHAEEASISPDKSAVASGIEVSFDELKLGYYLVDSSLGALCSLNTTNPTAVIEEKNEKPTVEKEDVNNETDDSPSVGDDVEYKITITAQPGAENYVLHDTMGEGLDLKTNTIKVYVGDESTALDSSKYVVENTDLTDDCTFEIRFNQEYLDTITASTTIIVKYSATLNENAIVGFDEVTNKAILDYGDENSTEIDPGTTITKVYSFDLVKTDSDKAVLDGAKFSLYDAETEGNLISLVELSKGNYRVATTDEKAAEGFVSAAIETVNGKATIDGLGNGTYYLQEEEAPDGYNKLAERTAVTISGADNRATVTDDGIYTIGGVNVINEAGALLPSTGGMGTTVIYIIGAVLVIGAGIVLVVRRRTNA